MRIHTHLEAEYDLLQIARYLSGVSPAALTLFEAELARTLAFLCAYPGVGADVGSARSYSLRRFGYKLIFQVKPDRLFVVAVVHHAQDDSHWRHRL